ncbi:MAG TPA: hypothetical protein ENJ18_16330 [Nannocystis exedens]|nr:hypothetical protein [Nannocystis exedens]
MCGIIARHDLLFFALIALTCGDETGSSEGTSTGSTGSTGTASLSGSSSSTGDTSSGSASTSSDETSTTDATATGSTGSTGATGSTTDTGTTGGAQDPSFGNSVLDDVSDMFDYVNGERQDYQPHDRYRGFPLAGGYHQTVTWPIVLEWSDSAAAIAQAQAQAVAQGAAPKGMPTFANPGTEPVYVEGVDTTMYMVEGVERPDQFLTEICTLCNSNPAMRMSVFYQDPGGQGPVLTKLGIGAADMGNGDTWWVLRFEE